MKNYFTILCIILTLLFSYCDTGNTAEQTAQLKADSISQKIDTTSKQTATTPTTTFNYSGTYKLKVDRFRDYYQYHKLTLDQQNDSITGTYSFDLKTSDNKLLANLKGVVNGKMNQTKDDVNSGTELYITLTERNFDSIKLFSYPDVDYAIRQFLYSPLLGTRFSVEKNTIENNYAGGEWDTWQRVK